MTAVGRPDAAQAAGAAWDAHQRARALHARRELAGSGHGATRT